MRQLGGTCFKALVFGNGAQADASAQAVQQSGCSIDVVRVPLDADHTVAAQRYGAQDGTTYLLRPDQHVAARWHHPSANAVRNAYARATAQPA